MPHYHLHDFDKPERFDPTVRREVLDEVRQAVRELAPDKEGNLHVSEVLGAVDTVEGGS